MQIIKDFKAETILVIIVFISMPLLAGNGSPKEKKSYKTSKILTSAPRIDGIIDDAAWEAVTWEGEFIQLQPYENKPPSQQTKFKIVYDDNNLYIAIKALDSAPDSIVRRMSRRDGFDGDWVEVNIDSYYDKRTAFSFTVNAAGVKGDEAITNDNHFDSSWDPIWYVKTSTDEEGWVAEMQIPLTQLRFGNKEEHTWGLQVNRLLFRKEERSSWQFISPTASGWVHNFGELFGISNIVPKKQKDITPYVVGRVENYEKEEGNPFATGRDYNGAIGVDGKFGITNNLTLDFTINPDFGQVEADPSEVNLSTFETYFPERRAFFIEGKNILNHQVTGGGSPLSRDNLFYSRRIGRRPSHYPDPGDGHLKMPDNTTIIGAFKLTGKTPEGWSIGVMESVTAKEFGQIDNEGARTKEIVEPLTNYFAARVEKDMNNSNTRVGAMVTATNRDLSTQALRDFMHQSAYTGGFNFNHQWKDKTYYLNINAVYSLVNGSKEAIKGTQTNAPHFFQRPDANYLKVDSNATSMDGFGGTVQMGKAGNGKLRYSGWITWRSPGLNLNDIGYMRRNDEVMQVLWAGYYQNEPFSIFRSAGINVNQWSGFTFGGDTRYYGGNINGHVQFKNYWRTGMGISREGKSISTETLRGGPSLVYDGWTDLWGSIGTDYRKKVSFRLNYWSGVRDFKTENRQNISLSMNLQISDAFKLSMRPSYSIGKEKIAYVTNIDENEPIRYIRGYLDQKTSAITFRFSYNITPDFTIQYYAMPFISAGNYKEFKYIDNPQADNFNDRYISFTDQQISNTVDEDGNKTYHVDENLDGNTNYSFNDPNFNVLDFNSNLVVRWEYLPGSTLYVVWTQHRSNYMNRGTYHFPDDAGNLFTDTYPHDVFLVKLSYRLGL